MRHFQFWQFQSWDISALRHFQPEKLSAGRKFQSREQLGDTFSPETISALELAKNWAWFLKIKCLQNWSYKKKMCSKTIFLNWKKNHIRTIQLIQLILNIEDSLWKSDFGTFNKLSKFRGFFWVCCFLVPDSLLYEK